ncbi:hypothetical protein [Halalkalicoccus tibetensis]|uniref:Uncharacterized protein n=1 Tax=Halalkalicoccus tibetensis TaxID=175632 RepID=A0ABD5V395_9EURY
MRGNESRVEAAERIPVTEERRRQLRELKGENRSYDELIGLLVQEHKRRRIVAAVDRDGTDDREARVRIDE